MKTGTAVRYERYGGFDVVKTETIEKPVPGRGEVLVRIAVAGLNHIERFVREGRLRDLVEISFPAGQGVEFAGTVLAVGPGVSGLRRGDEVVGHLPGGGTHATWIAVPAVAVVKKPAGVPVEVAGGLYLAGCTALSIVDRLRLGPTDTVVISAAAGGVGHIEAQLALRAGARVIGLGSPGNHDYLRQLGVVPVTYGDGSADRVRTAAKGSPLTAFIDNHGDDEAVAWAADLGIPAERVILSDHRRDVEIRFLTAPADDAEATAMLARALALVADRQIAVLVSGFYPFRYIVEAYQDLARMHSRGKVVVGMDPVETGAREPWYLTEKAREFRDRVEPPRTPAGDEAEDSPPA